MAPSDSPLLMRDAPQWLARVERAPSPAAQLASTSHWPSFLIGQADRPVRVLLVDEEVSARRAISHELLMDSRICVIGEAGSLLEAKRLLAQQAFDVLILDVGLGGGKGFNLIESVRRHRSSAEVIVHSTLGDEVHVRRAFAAGASGYLLKNAWFQSFTQAVLQVVNGGAAVSPNVIRHLLIRLGSGAPAEPNAARTRIRTLSTREREVLRLVAAGYVTRHIAERLSISGQTVCAHMKNIYRKLQVHTRAHAVTTASGQGML
ncbi:LuxR C-terminal-related transcriptional regulator [Variovorax boronicumulans]|uniref:LuxR C-terminal-related transcriptional regulator n=1 Tax=Variovorax boronicumulans TaxID=436515 RepID=UPI0027D7731D|nr:LuxR C-terminal-related transcriptional regulator [Variovorax boronicumulans]